MYNLYLCTEQYMCTEQYRCTEPVIYITSRLGVAAGAGGVARREAWREEASGGCETRG